MDNSSSRPDYGAMQLAIFRDQDPGGVLWQPRFDWWYKVNTNRGTMPDHLKGASMLDVYDYCHASCRYFLSDRSWFSDRSWLRSRFNTVEVTSEWETPYRLRHTWHTPIGSLTQVSQFDDWHVSAPVAEYRIKRPEDFKIIRYMLEDEEWFWDTALFEHDLAVCGAYGTPQFYYRRSPVQRLFIEDMGLENTVYFMADHPDLLQEYIEFASAADDRMYDVITACPVEIINLGENIDGYLNSPSIWHRHLVPYYNKRIQQLHAAGKRVSIHMDGKLKSLLPYLDECMVDAIEAPTPLPQGDISLEQLQAAVGNRVIMDGIPGVYFIPELYPIEPLIACVRELVDMFYPRLVLGVSDEFPPDGDIERARMIGELVQTMR